MIFHALVRELMQACGDVDEPALDSAMVLEDLVNAYVADMVRLVAISMSFNGVNCSVWQLWIL